MKGRPERLRAGSTDLFPAHPVSLYPSGEGSLTKEAYPDTLVQLLSELQPFLAIMVQLRFQTGEARA